MGGMSVPAPPPVPPTPRMPVPDDATAKVAAQRAANSLLPLGPESTDLTGPNRAPATGTVLGK